MPVYVSMLTMPSLMVIDLKSVAKTSRGKLFSLHETLFDVFRIIPLFFGSIQTDPLSLSALPLATLATMIFFARALSLRTSLRTNFERSYDSCLKLGLTSSIRIML